MRKFAGFIFGVMVVLLMFYFMAGRDTEKAHEDRPVAGENGPTPTETLTRDAIIRLSNDARISHGQTPLEENQLLNEVAEERLRDMFMRQYIGHVSPLGEQASDYAQRIGYRYKIIAENIASGNFLNNRKVMDGWMQSPGHRQNILSPDIAEIGVAIDKGLFQGNSVWIAVQIFGTQSPPVSPKRLCLPPPEELYVEIESKKGTIEDLAARLTRFRHELDEEIASIESDKRVIDNTNEAAAVNKRIRNYNENNRRYNDLLANLTAKRKIFKALVEDYNKRVSAYNDCLSTNN